MCVRYNCSKELMPFKEQTAARAPFINNSVSRAKRGSKYGRMGGPGEKEEERKGECGLHV